MFYLKNMVEPVIVVMVIVLIIVLLLFCFSIFHVIRYFFGQPNSKPNGDEITREELTKKEQESHLSNQAFLSGPITYGNPFLTVDGKVVSLTGGRNGTAVTNRDRVIYKDEYYIFSTSNGQPNITSGNYFYLYNQLGRRRFEVA